MGKKSTKKVNGTPERILQAIRARIGAEASLQACTTALAAASNCSPASANKILTGRHIRQDVARKVAAALADWGCHVPAGDIAMGSVAEP